MIGKHREEVLIFRASPDITLGMVCEAHGAHTERAPVRMTGCQFQKKRNKGEEDGIAEHENELNGQIQHRLTALLAA
jgi:hypothetical protein